MTIHRVGPLSLLMAAVLLVAAACGAPAERPPGLTLTQTSLLFFYTEN